MTVRVLGDWGTSRLRLFLMDGEEVADRMAGPGIGAVLGGGAADALAAALSHLGADAAAHVVLCGMAGARGGVIEAPYAVCPAAVAVWMRAAAHTTSGSREVRVAAGLRCRNFADGPDVMRGEETQIFGALALDPALARGSQIVALPGTHSKWVSLVDGAIERFHSFPTGELFALLSDRSTLLRAGDGGDDSGENAVDGLEAGVARGLSGAGLAASLFQTRAAQLLDGRSAAWASAFLSGLLIGDEVRAGLALAGAPERVTLIGDPALCGRYARALGRAGVAVRPLDGDTCALAGLKLLAAA